MGTVLLNGDDINALSTMKVDNNMSGVIASLKSNGVPYLGVQTNTGIVKFLMSLYIKNQELYFTVLKGVPPNPNANNYTTNPEFINQISSL